MYAKKNSGKKILAMVLAVVLLIGVGVGGTLAWLTATSGTVTNTFTVGDINITLQEYPFKENSTTQLDEDVAKAVNAISTYKVVPGGEQPKKPFVTVEANSENCYVYVTVENNLTIEKNIVVTYDINTTEWVQVGTAKVNSETGAVTTLYRYKDIVTNNTADQIKTVFTKVSYNENILKSNINQLENKTIVLNAFAHQSDNTTQDVADAAAKDHFDIA